VTLEGRYREPYNARNSSVSWNPMIGINLLKVAKHHVYSVQTMLENYAAWLDGTTKSDLKAVEQAMGVPPGSIFRYARDAHSREGRSPIRDFAPPPVSGSCHWRRRPRATA
jgi:hypothetical protein